MIYIALAELVVILALVALVYAIEKANAEERAGRADAYEKTLHTMANRIQAPERLPVDEMRTFPDPEPEIDLSALVGTISYDEPEEDE